MLCGHGGQLYREHCRDGRHCALPCGVCPVRHEGFSYDTTVEALTASPEVVEHEPTPDLDTTVARLIDTTGLTAREAEIFALLAQGRNGAYIQRQLGVSYNTVKTHVAHIYTKLGVHSHQELIDLVERA